MTMKRLYEEDISYEAPRKNDVHTSFSINRVLSVFATSLVVTITLAEYNLYSSNDVQAEYTVDSKDESVRTELLRKEVVKELGNVSELQRMFLPGLLTTDSQTRLYLWKQAIQKLYHTDDRLKNEVMIAVLQSYRSGALDMKASLALERALKETPNDVQKIQGLLWNVVEE